MTSHNISSNETMKNFYNRARPILKARGYTDVLVGWDDCTRGYGSTIGPNISDWSFKLKDGTVLPFIRGPNYQDRTLTIPTKDLAIVVGNQKPDSKLEPITFDKYLKNYGKYTPGVPDYVDLSAGPNELVTIRFIAVVVPEEAESHTAEGVWTSYNYQTLDRKDPKNFIGVSFHMGVGSRTDGPNCEPVYLVKTNLDGSYENTWFRLTNEKTETEEQKKITASVLGARSTGSGRNRVQCFQIPRKQTKKQIFRGLSNGDESFCGNSGVDECYRPNGISVANVTFGSFASKYSMEEGITYERDLEQNITFTFGYYLSIPKSGQFNETELENLMDVLDKSYKDTKAMWDGSLVTGKLNSSFKGNIEPLIQLPNVSKQDYLTFNQKIIHQSKNLEAMGKFPEGDELECPYDCACATRVNELKPSKCIVS
tara:strand:+ start:516 stop:1793 length:1278 start_codon:yes stop_codon:yes gene_type:complete